MLTELQKRAIIDDILGDLVFEDTYALWEIAAAVRSSPIEIQESEVEMTTRDIILELVEAGDAYVYRIQGDDPPRSSEDPALRVSTDDLRRILASDGWIRGEDGRELWLAATEGVPDNT